jgi:Fe-S oxidoreductase
MHALVAGGTLAGSVLLAGGVVPALRESRLYWSGVSTFFLVALGGTYLVWKRRNPKKPSYLSGGKFLWLPNALLAWTLGGALVAFAQAALPDSTGAALLPLVMMAAGGAGLVVQAARGPMRHAFSGVTWLAAHSRPERFGGGRSTDLRPLDLAAPVLGALVPGDFAWNILTSFDACIECGRCEQHCPAFAAGQRLNPKALVQGLALAARGESADAYTGSPAPHAPPTAGVGGMDSAIIGADAMIHPDTLWACTTCRSCVEQCPMMIEHVDAIVDLRRGQTLMHGAVRPGAADALRRLRDTGESGGRPLSARADGLAGDNVPVLGEDDETDVLLWLGDGAYELRYARTLRALVKLLRLAGVRFAILGEAELDCGDLARRLGDEATFQGLATEIIGTLNSRRFQRIVTADPHALNVLKNEYPALGGRWEVLHHTTLLDELVSAGRLKLAARDLPAVAYHDPCYLGRYNGEFDAPRRLLAAACGKTVEMERHGRQSMCCGGGGGNPVSDVDAAQRIPDLRMGQARDVGAAIVAVGCPGCTAMLEGVPEPRPEVKDIAELVLDAVVSA